MVPYLEGIVAFQSNQSLEEVGKLISERLFVGFQFGGKEEYIYEEISSHIHFGAHNRSKSHIERL